MNLTVLEGAEVGFVKARAHYESLTKSLRTWVWPAEPERKLAQADDARRSAAAAVARKRATLDEGARRQLADLHARAGRARNELERTARSVARRAELVRGLPLSEYLSLLCVRDENPGGRAYRSFGWALLAVSLAVNGLPALSLWGDGWGALALLLALPVANVAIAAAAALTGIAFRDDGHFRWSRHLLKSALIPACMGSLALTVVLLNAKGGC